MWRNRERFKKVEEFWDWARFEYNSWRDFWCWESEILKLKRPPTSGTRIYWNCNRVNSPYAHYGDGNALLELYHCNIFNYIRSHVAQVLNCLNNKSLESDIWENAQTSDKLRSKTTGSLSTQLPSWKESENLFPSLWSLPLSAQHITSCLSVETFRPLWLTSD